MDYKEKYRDEIIEMVQRIDNIKFLRQIYTIVVRYIRKTGN